MINQHTVYTTYILKYLIVFVKCTKKGSKIPYIRIICLLLRLTNSLFPNFEQKDVNLKIILPDFSLFFALKKFSYNPPFIVYIYNLKKKSFPHFFPKYF